VHGVNHFRYVDSTPRLDTDYPYREIEDDDFGENTTSTADDSPASGWASNFLTSEVRNEALWMYVMVKPDYSDAIFVPTQVAKWVWGFTAAKNPTTGVWGMTSVPTTPTVTGPTATTEFPVWTRNVQPMHPQYRRYTP
jgi:hypothetical protein